MPLASDFQLMARYNQWMNTRLYAQAAALDETELRASSASAAWQTRPGSCRFGYGTRPPACASCVKAAASRPR
jgi:hypothetical protein